MRVRMRGLSASPERRSSSASASSRPSRPKCACSRYTIAHRWRPSSTLTWNRLRMSYSDGQVRPEVALLLDRRGLGVALRDDDPAQRRTVLARHLLPDRLALVRAERRSCDRLPRRQEDAPAVVGHLHVVEVRPALRVDAESACAGRRRRLRTSRGPSRSTSRRYAGCQCSSARCSVLLPARARRCSGSSRCSRCHVHLHVAEFRRSRGRRRSRPRAVRQTRSQLNFALSPVP